MKNSKATIYVSVTVFIMLAIACLTSLSIAGENIRSEDRQVSGFHKLDLGGSFIVEISQGQESLRLEAEDNVLSDIITEVKDGELRISMKGKIRHHQDIKVFLSFKDLDEISSSGSVVMKGKALKFDKLKLDLSGSSDLDLQMEASSVKADMSGSTDARLTGTVNDMNVEISGAGSLEASELATENFGLEISGSGDAKVNVAKQLDVDISGSGSVAYKGNPNIKKSISGSGSVKKIG